MQPAEPRNPFYFLLLVTGLLFTITAVAYAVMPILIEKAIDEGNRPPPSPLRDAFLRDGWKWLLVEVAALVLFGLLSMGLDRLRRLQNDRASATMPPTDRSPDKKL